MRDVREAEFHCMYTHVSDLFYFCYSIFMAEEETAFALHELPLWDRLHIHRDTELWGECKRFRYEFIVAILNKLSTYFHYNNII